MTSPSTKPFRLYFTALAFIIIIAMAYCRDEAKGGSYGTVEDYVRLAFKVRKVTTYGYGEGNCGDVGHPRGCVTGAITASGEKFDTSLPTAAVAAPFNLRLTPMFIYAKLESTKFPEGCVMIKVNDKMNPRHIGRIGFDLSPKAVELLTGKPAPAKGMWVGKLVNCADYAETK